MDCSGNSEILSAYIDKELTDEELRAVELHLNQCVTCRQEVESLEATISLVSSLPRVSSPIDLAESIRVPEAPSKGIEVAPLENAKSSPGHPIIPPSRHHTIKYLLWPALATAAVALVVIGVSLRWSREPYTADEARIAAVATETADKGVPDRDEGARTRAAAIKLTEVANVQETVKTPAAVEGDVSQLAVRLECQNVEGDRANVLKILDDMKVTHKEMAMGNQTGGQEGMGDKEKSGQDEPRVIVFLSRVQREQLYAQIKNISSIRITGGQDILFSMPAQAGMMAMGNKTATSTRKSKKNQFSLSEADTNVAVSAPRAKEFPKPKARSFSKATSSPSKRRPGAASAGLPHEAESQRSRRSVETKNSVSTPSLAAKTEAPDPAIIVQSRARVQKMREAGEQAEATGLATNPVDSNTLRGEDEDIRRIEIRFVRSRSQ